MDALRRADAHIAAATHPRRNLRWRLNRYNPMHRWNMKKHHVTHPVTYQKQKLRRKINYINPLFYLRRIKNNLCGIVGHHKH
uniref:Uncharacterized protein n=1 Tax=Physcomitrium patens TaxID=3218 RepID=A0A2K1IFK5_PHYPA|nr:hypothetical protein PHYPA_028655 [Physcomitrium patens]